MTPYNFLPIPERTVADLRKRDDACEVRKPFSDDDGGAPLRCCLRRSEPGDDIMLVSYAPLPRWARSVGADPAPYDELGPVFVHAGPCAVADRPRTALVHVRAVEHGCFITEVRRAR